MPDSVSRAFLDSILPPGSLWIPAEDEDFDKLLDGIAENMEEAKAYLAKLAKVRDPKFTDVLSDLEREFGIVTDTTILEADRRTELAAVKYFKGTGGTRDGLQNLLRMAGYDVYVHDNDPAVDPQTIMIALIFYLAGRQGFKTISPTDPNDWPLVFFIGGQATRDGITNELTSIDIAYIPEGKQTRFRKLVQANMPMHTWAGMCFIVYYSADYFGFYEDPGALGFSSIVESGTNTTASLNKLIDSTALFITNSVQVGDIVYNDTESLSSEVLTIDSETQLTIQDNIFSATGREYRVVTGGGRFSFFEEAA